MYSTRTFPLAFDPVPPSVLTRRVVISSSLLLSSLQIKFRPNHKSNTRYTASMLPHNVNTPCKPHRPQISLPYSNAIHLLQKQLSNTSINHQNHISLEQKIKSKPTCSCM